MIPLKNEALCAACCAVLRETLHSFTLLCKRIARALLPFIPAVNCWVFRRRTGKPGFTLIEVMLATALVGVALGPIYMLQNTVFDRVMRMAESVQRMFVAYDFFLDTQKQKAAGAQQKRFTKKIPDPKTELIYEIKELPRGSVLKTEFDHLYIEKVTWNWSILGTSYDDVLVNIVFEPPKEKKEKEEKEPATKDKDKAKDKNKQEPTSKQPPKPAGGKP